MIETLVAQNGPVTPIRGKSYYLPLLPFLVMGVYLALRFRKQREVRRLKERRRQATGEG
jgi:hypothetical protein